MSAIVKRTSGIVVLAPVLLSGTVMSAGCASITGSWQRVETRPPGVPFPLDAITFDADGRFTASWMAGGRTYTSTGAYSRDGSTLMIHEVGRLPRPYELDVAADTLEMTYSEGGASVTAVLKKVDPSRVVSPERMAP